MAMPDAWLDGYRWASGESHLCDLESENALAICGYVDKERVLW